jgi:hypothetical protein
MASPYLWSIWFFRQPITNGYMEHTGTGRRLLTKRVKGRVERVRECDWANDQEEKLPCHLENVVQRQQAM